MPVAAVALTGEARDKQTVRDACGVRTNPGHWAAQTVHAFRTWTGPKTLVTWCGIDVDLEQRARQTKDLVSCVQCAQASYTALVRN